jgi:hypothetical protein
MDVEVLIIVGCPYAVAVDDLLRRLLDEAGLAETTVRTTVIMTQDDAELRTFPGSPTVLLDGNDAYPEPGLSPALACRIYQTSDGPRSLPEEGLLREAIRLASTTSTRLRPHEGDADNLLGTISLTAPLCVKRLKTERCR